MSPARTPATTRIATGCAVAYGSAFLLSGLFFIYLALTAEADPDDRMAYYFALLMGSFFTIGGSVWLYNIRHEFRDLQVASELQSAAPGKPWMWRSDWVAGYAVEVLRAGHQRLWLWTIGWGLITAAVLWEARKGMPDVSGLRLVVAAIVLGAIVLLSKATYRTLRTRRYGDVRLYLHANPYRIGHPLSATLKATSRLAPTGPMNVTLAYVHERVTTSSRGVTFTHENILWSETCSIETAAMTVSSGTVEVPIHFEFRGGGDGDADSTDDAIHSNRHYWRIDAEAPVKGIDFKARFEIPVWRKG